MVAHHKPIPHDMLTPTTGKIYSCAGDVTIHIQDIDTQQILCTVHGERGHDVRFSMPTQQNIATVYGPILREYQSSDRKRVRIVAIENVHLTDKIIVENSCNVLCRATLKRNDIVRIELLGETP